jgi:hypothetical protein
VAVPLPASRDNPKQIWDYDLPVMVEGAGASDAATFALFASVAPTFTPEPGFHLRLFLH